MTGSVEVKTPLSTIDNYVIANGQTLQEMYDAHEMLHNKPVVCVVNNKPVLRKDWNQVIKPHDKVSFCVMPLGGGTQHAHTD